MTDDCAAVGLSCGRVPAPVGRVELERHVGSGPDDPRHSYRRGPVTS